jgi:hypothetical protein
MTPLRNWTPFFLVILCVLGAPSSPTLNATDPSLGLEKLTERQAGSPYKLQIEYSGKTFFDGWDFFDDPGEPFLAPAYCLQLTFIRSEQWL